MSPSKSERRSERQAFKKNKLREDRLRNIPQVSIEDDNSDLTCRCKFNFSYFTVNTPEEEYPASGQTFKEWEELEILSDLVEKLKEHSKKSIQDLEKTPIGRKGGHILEIYPAYPSHSRFRRPRNIPAEVSWCRIRLANKRRLIGFVLDWEKYHNTEYSKTGERYDSNTFYVVFLDKDHEFYPLA